MPDYPYIPLFWNGQHKNKGEKKNWTAEDVTKIFNGTQEFSADKIPFTVDHPANDLPIIGWTNKENMRLVTVGNRTTIEAKPTEFSEPYLDRIKQEGKKKVSISITPGNYAMRHIGLVEHPAVTDLPQIPFEEEELICFEMEFDDVVFDDTPSGDTPTDNNFSINSKEGVMPDNTTETPKAEDNAELLQFKADLEAKSAELATKEARIAELEAKQREMEFNQFLDTPEIKEKITPAYRDQVLRLLKSLDGQAEFEFSEGTEKKKTTPVEDFKALLSSLPKQVMFGEFAKEGGKPVDNANIIEEVIEQVNEGR